MSQKNPQQKLPQQKHLSPRTILTASLFAALLPVLTGCGGALSGTAGPANSFVTPGTLSGKIHGGNQPIVGATISLYAAGNSGYGSAGTLYAQTTSLNDGAGSFSFTQTTGGSPTGPPSSITSTYACPTGSPTNPDPQMYLIASGGETQGVGNGANPAAAFILAIGPCSTAATPGVNLFINEVTTVGTLAALQQYFNPMTESFGYPAAAASYFINGQQAIANLVNIGTGQAVSSSTHTATPAGGVVTTPATTVSVTVTPEVNQIYTLSNILAACVNNTSSTATNCNTLFADAVPADPSVTSQPTTATYTTSTKATDTLQALYFMLTNPTSGLSPTNMRGLFGLTSATAPFQPSYTSAPTDWTIALSLTSASTCTLATTGGTTNAAKFLNGVNNLAVDNSGGIWGVTTGTNGGLFEISPTGNPLACGLGALANSITSMTLDVNGNPWVASATKQSSSYDLIKWSNTGGQIESTWKTTNEAAGVTADGNGNIFYGDSKSLINEFANAAPAGATVTAAKELAALTSTAYEPTGTAEPAVVPDYMAADSNGNVWITDQDEDYGISLYQLVPSTSTTAANYMNGYQEYTITPSADTNAASGIYNPYGLAVRAVYNTATSSYTTELFTSNGAGSGAAGHSYEWAFINPGATVGTATVTNTIAGFAGNDSARGVAVDGAGNVWMNNNNASTGNWVTGATTPSDYSISEISVSGAALSATSATGTGVYGGSTGGFQKPSPFITVGTKGLAIDPTGNVWFGMNSSTATNIVELIGAGVPTVTPLAYAASVGKLGQMP